jgi:hypothetical protein
MPNQVYYDKNKRQYYTLNNRIIGGSTINYISDPQNTKTDQSYKLQPFTPNAITQAQLQGASNGMAPQWMLNAYSNKIGRMGGNANLPPFAVTQSGFPGMGGKTAPAGTTGTGG